MSVRKVHVSVRFIVRYGTFGKLATIRNNITADESSPRCLPVIDSEIRITAILTHALG